MAGNSDPNPSRRKAAAAGILFGVGLGGFFDGILLHQILQWHQMLSSVLPPDTLEAMHINMLGDGLFHAFTWFVTVAAMFLLWAAARRREALPSSVWFVGLLLLGWGLFNLIEGLINHQILGLHHVIGEPHAGWDWGFVLLGGVGLIVVGGLMIRAGGRPRPR
ncbi:DUF2243 domain-containing protein [Ectothiorhodospiraceae bacterium 2226]|nr:DUF2243 domain-containing protein [Ectothiorhodospiraceae bacterium 2226]